MASELVRFLRLDPRLERFILVTPEDDWLWLGPVNSTGYGRVKRDGRMRLVHRYAYELLVGPIPEGKELDHLCRVRACLRPSHLEPVTHRENCARGLTGQATGARNRAKTKCPHGHLLDGVRQSGVGAGERYCKTCNRERWRARKAAV